MTDVVLVGAVVALATLVLQHIAGPMLSVWYQERLYRARSAVDRRHEVRRMVENELEKGFDDLSACRAFLLAVGAALGNRGNLAVQFLPNFAAHEQKWGVWRPYLIQDEAVERLCEDYRTQIRDLRVSVMSSQDPLSLQDSVANTEREMREKSRAIVAEVDKRKW